jgi:hypothetical protein
MIEIRRIAISLQSSTSAERNAEFEDLFTVHPCTPQPQGTFTNAFINSRTDHCLEREWLKRPTSLIDFAGDCAILVSKRASVL